MHARNYKTLALSWFRKIDPKQKGVWFIYLIYGLFMVLFVFVYIILVGMSIEVRFVTQIMYPFASLTVLFGFND